MGQAARAGDVAHIFKQLHGGILLIAGFGCRPAVGASRWTNDSP